jgi:hypothetical protein
MTSEELQNLHDAAAVRLAKARAELLAATTLAAAYQAALPLSRDLANMTEADFAGIAEELEWPGAHDYALHAVAAKKLKAAIAARATTPPASA